MAVNPAAVVLALKFTAVPAQIVVAEAVICGSFTLIVTAVRVVLSQLFSVWEAYTVWPSVKTAVLASKLPPVAASYQFTPVPVADKFATVMAVPAQKVWVAAAMGAAGGVVHGLYNAEISCEVKARFQTETSSSEPFIQPGEFKYDVMK